MTDNPDLFAPEEIRICKTCCSCFKSATTPGHFCDRSLKTIKPTDPACELWGKGKEE